MSRQTLLHNYFKANSGNLSSSVEISNSSRKRISADLTQMPTTTKTKKTINYSSDNIIDLCSDDETGSAGSSNSDTNCDSSQHLNPICSISTNRDASSTVANKLDTFPSNEIDCAISPNPYTGSNLNVLEPDCELTESLTIVSKITPKTPKNKSTPNSKSSGKYFSPNKNRLVQNRSPGKTKIPKVLFQDVDTSDDLDSSQDDITDDKSLILLTNINNLVKDTLLFNLLDKKSQDVLNKCLTIDKQLDLKLVCRLFWRQHIWYTLPKLSKICENKENVCVDKTVLQKMLNLLVNNDILQDSSNDINSLQFEELGKKLSFHQIKQICKDFNIKISSKSSKHGAINSLKTYCQQKSISTYFAGTGNRTTPVMTNQERALNKMRDILGNCYKLSESAKTAIYKLYLLMYLGINYNIIRDKKLEWTIIYDKIKKETYPVDKTMKLDNASYVFRSQQEFESYFEAHLIYENFLATENVVEKCKIVETVYYNLYKNIEDHNMQRYLVYPEWLHRYTPPYIYIQILEKGVNDLKRHKETDKYLLAVDILTILISQKGFRQYKIGDWYAEKALILHKYLRRHDEAATLLIEGFKSNIPDTAKETMQPRALIISNQQNTFITDELREELRSYATKDSKLEKNLPSEFISAQPMDSNNKGKIKFIINTEEVKMFMDVEDLCVYYCKNVGGFTHAEHWEGRIVTTIFYLLFWDIIYTKPVTVSGVFLTYYQMHPLDMYCGSFYINRKTAIEDKLSKIAQYTEEELLEDMKNIWLKRPEYETSCIVRKLEWKNIAMVASCLGAKKVAIICKRFATNYGHAIKGFPDVTAWNFNTKKIKFLEVKSDSDKPSFKQIQWMHYLHSNGIDTGFVYVGANPNRQKSRAKILVEETDDSV